MHSLYKARILRVTYVAKLLLWYDRMLFLKQYHNVIALFLIVLLGCSQHPPAEIHVYDSKVLGEIGKGQLGIIESGAALIDDSSQNRIKTSMWIWADSLEKFSKRASPEFYSELESGLKRHGLSIVEVKQLDSCFMTADSLNVSDGIPKPMCPLNNSRFWVVAVQLGVAQARAIPSNGDAMLVLSLDLLSRGSGSSMPPVKWRGAMTFRVGIWDTLTQRYVATVLSNYPVNSCCDTSDIAAGAAAAQLVVAKLNDWLPPSVTKDTVDPFDKKWVAVLRGYYSGLGSVTKFDLPSGAKGGSSSEYSMEFMLGYFPGRFGLGVLYHGPGFMTSDFKPQDGSQVHSAKLHEISGLGIKAMYNFAPNREPSSILNMQTGLSFEYLDLSAVNNGVVHSSELNGLGIRPEVEVNIQFQHIQYGLYTGLQIDIAKTSTGKNASFVYMPIGFEIGVRF